MSNLQTMHGIEDQPAAGKISMDEMWTEAANEFEKICHKPLRKDGVNTVMTFDDVQRQIESVTKASYGPDENHRLKRERAKNIGLESLKLLKMLVGTAAQAAALFPIPPAAASLTTSALNFVFDMPKNIKGYSDAVDEVFSEVSSALSQFRIYESMDNARANHVLIPQIHRVMVSFVKLCAHVVKYRQSGSWNRFHRKAKVVLLDEDGGLAGEMKKFKEHLQQKHDIEGTLTLVTVIENRRDIATLFEKSLISIKMVEDIQQGMQSLLSNADRSKTLNKIRDALSVPPTVHLDTNTTQTCTNISKKCFGDTGSWIWTSKDYTAWTNPKNKDSHAFLLSGPPSSGKTSATALIVKRLEEAKPEERTYVAHFFFPGIVGSSKKAEDEKNPVHSALKYMAFQIARVDPNMLRALGKACEAVPSYFRSSANLDSLWSMLKIGNSKSGATYYLVFDGLENLPNEQAKMLRNFVCKIGGQKGHTVGRVRFLLSGTDDCFPEDDPAVRSALRVRMEKHNGLDMRTVIENALNAGPGLDLVETAKLKILERLPQIVEGSYSNLEIGLQSVMRLLRTRTPIKELDRILNSPIKTHELAIKNLQESLTTNEIEEINELLKWVLFTYETMNLDQLEAIMFLFSGTKSLVTLQYIVKQKYSAVLKLEGNDVYGQDGIRDFFQEEQNNFDKASQSKDAPTINMTINIHNADLELCGHFLWDLSERAIREKFNFELKKASDSLHNNAIISVNEFEAHYTIVKRAFQYLEQEPTDQTKKIGQYVINWLLQHLESLRKLEEEGKGRLRPDQQSNIGQNLYKMFRNGELVERHWESFGVGIWWAKEMVSVREWFLDTAIAAVVRKQDKKWCDRMREPDALKNPTKDGYLEEFVRVVVKGLFCDSERSWPVDGAVFWIKEFMKVDKNTVRSSDPDDATNTSSSGTDSNSLSKTDCDDISQWCQNFLDLDELELDSLWYERLAEAASNLATDADTVRHYYERALSLDNPSWLCYRGLGKTYFQQNHPEEAVAKVQLALDRAQETGATPDPKAKDIVSLHLLLGQYAEEAGDVQAATEHFSIACNYESDDADQAKTAKLGLLKARLKFADVEPTRTWLRESPILDGPSMVSILSTIALDDDPGAILSKLFTVAESDQILWERIVRALELATAESTAGHFGVPKKPMKECFAEVEARGVLLYYRGVAAYTKASDGMEYVGKALQLWTECRKLLSDVGGSNASLARRCATTDLAKHHFQDMLKKKHENLDVTALSALLDSDSGFEGSDALGFLGVLYAIRGDMDESKKVLRPQFEYAIQILEDDTPDNDCWGFSCLQETLAQHGDLKNSAIALSFLCQPDLVTEALYFPADGSFLKEYVAQSGMDSQQLLSELLALGRAIIETVQKQVPDSSQQVRRIETARSCFKSLQDAFKKPCSGKSESADSDRVTAEAHNLVEQRLDSLAQNHTTQIDVDHFPMQKTCDGRTSDGRHCRRLCSFGDTFYVCIYCTNKVLCEDCLKRLRDSRFSGEFAACSPMHKWLKVPRYGEKSIVSIAMANADALVHVPIVETAVEDEQIFEVRYADHEMGEVTTLGGWKENLIAEWNVDSKSLGFDVQKGGKEDKIHV